MLGPQNATVEEHDGPFVELPFLGAEWSPCTHVVVEDAEDKGVQESDTNLLIDTWVLIDLFSVLCIGSFSMRNPDANLMNLLQSHMNLTAKMFVLMHYAELDILSHS